MPQRIQRRRTKGWRKPEGAVYVGRGSRWGNPWRAHGDPERAARLYRHAVEHQEIFLWRWEYAPLPEHDEIRAEVGGRDLMCWCPLDQPCHADVLLEIANRDGGTV